jgi:hypothetical protein
MSSGNRVRGHRSKAMFFKQCVNDDASISYFFGCAGHGKAVAVDVLAGNEGWFIEAAKQANIAITHVMTHISMRTDLKRGDRCGAPMCLAGFDQYRACWIVK